MTRLLRFSLRVALSGLALGASSPAHAGDWYVDAVNGSDANGGTSPADAWQTIRHALATIPDPLPGQNQVIHTAPGTYDAALGESFPLTMRPAFQLVGDQGSSVTVIDGSTAPAFATITIDTDVLGNDYTFGPDTLVQGFQVIAASRGFDIRSDWNPCDPTLRDVVVTGAATAGIAISAGGALDTGFVNPTLERLRVTGNAVGMDVFASTFGGSAVADFTLSDSTVSGNTTLGMRLLAGAASVKGTLRRCRIESSGTDGVSVEYGNIGSTKVVLEDCIVASNGADGVHIVPDQGLGGAGKATLLRTTVASNGAVGVETDDESCPQCGHQAVLDGTLIFGNADDVDLALLPAPTVQFCDIGDGDFAGSNGNFTADPLFVDAASGDWRLSWGSPCAESGNPATAPGTLDVASLARPIDGDLDAAEAYDVGAHEMAPLDLGCPAVVGGSLCLEFWGPAGAPSALFTSLLPPLATPLATPYGDLDLDPGSLFPSGAFAAAPGPPGTAVFPIPNNPLLSGLSLTFQALTLTGLGPPPAAFTNPRVVTIS